MGKNSEYSIEDITSGLKIVDKVRKNSWDKGQNPYFTEYSTNFVMSDGSYALLFCGKWHFSPDHSTKKDEDCAKRPSLKQLSRPYVMVLSIASEPPLDGEKCRYYDKLWNDNFSQKEGKKFFHILENLFE